MALADLAELNRRLIVTGSPFTQVEESTSDDPFAQGLSAAGIQVDPNEDADDEEVEKKPDEFKSFAAVDRLEFERVVNYIIENGFGGEASGRTTAIDAFVNGWAVEWRDRKGISKTEALSAVPTLDELLNAPDVGEDFGRGAGWLKVTSEGGLPDLFTTSTTRVNPETDETEVVPVIGVADALTGVEFIETTVASDPRVWGSRVASKLHEVIKRNPRSEAAADVINRAHATGFDNLDPFGMPDDVFLMDLYRNLPPEQEASQALPNYTTDELGDIFSGSEGQGPSSGSRTQRSIEFDRTDLADQVSQVWADWYLEEPPEGPVADIVDAYVREARSFWVGKGGKLEFDTFVRNRLKKQPKYQLFFKNKAPDMTEEQHNAQFVNPIRSLGLRPEVASAEGVAAVTSGGSPTEQLKRVSRTAEAQNVGGFSRRLASTVAGLGAGARG